MNAPYASSPSTRHRGGPRGGRRPAPRRAASRRGLTLLEVILSIAIFGLAMATMGELVRLGLRAAAGARDLTKAQILCEGKMSELAAGVIPPEPVEQAPFELEPDWTYSVIVGPSGQEGLLMALVTVEQVVEDGQTPVTFTLSRWMVDPLLEQAEDPAAPAENATPPTPTPGGAPAPGGAR